MNNKDSSRQFLMDLLESIIDDLALTSHAKENISYLARQNEDIDFWQDIHDLALENRRYKMNLLFSYSDDYDADMWCAFKHAADSYGKSIEVWQAEDNNKTFESMLASERILMKIFSKAMGFKLEVCGRCLSEQIKYKEENGNI